MSKNNKKVGYAFMAFSKGTETGEGKNGVWKKQQTIVTGKHADIS